MSGVRYIWFALNPAWVVLLSKVLLSTYLSFEKFSNKRYIRYILQLIELMKPVTSSFLKKFKKPETTGKGSNIENMLSKIEEIRIF